MIQKRIQHARRLLKQKSYAALFTDDPKMLLYLTGMSFSVGKLVMTQETAHLFLDGRYTNQAEPLKERFFIHPISTSKSLDKDLVSACAVTGPLAFSPSKTSYSVYCKLQSSFPTLAPDEDFFAELRRKKEKKELILLQKAAHLTQEVMKEAFSFCRKGISEKDLSCIIKRLFLDKGADISFEPIVAFGKNSACPHWHPTDERLDDPELVLIDCGALWKNYAGDMTRVLFLKKPQKKLQEAFLAVQKAYEAAAQAAKAGARCSEIDAQARAVLKKAKLESFFTHGLGHGVGLEVHEAPRLNKTATHTSLFEGDVITIEPGVYLPGIGGIRLENTLVIEKEGARSLMSMPF